MLQLAAVISYVIGQRNPSYRPSLVQKNSLGSASPPFAGSDLVLSPSQWSSHVVGKISSWIDLDSEDETVRLDSETTLRQELAWASHLSLQACLLPAPKGTSCANYARCVNQILQDLSNMQLWLRISLVVPDDDSMDANSATLVSKYARNMPSTLPSASSLGRWFGESVRAAIVNTDSFLTNGRGYPCLSKRHQMLITRFFNHNIQIIISANSGTPKASVDANDFHNRSVADSQRHPLRLYLDYVGHLYQKMDPLPEQERFELGYRDYLQSPLQPLMDNLEARTYETFEKDAMKYIQYQRAVSKAMLDMIPDEEASTKTIVLMVVGAGRGPLVRASLQASEETGRKLKVYAVEKNPNAVVTLHALVKLEGWEDIVTIVSSDMRYWNAPEKADILVSELLGSFGDNELSPECLDGAQRFLKPEGISIPSSLPGKMKDLRNPFSKATLLSLCSDSMNMHDSGMYTSFIQPVTASKLYNDVKAHKDVSHFETAYVVKIHNAARLAPCQSVFTFTHPKSVDSESPVDSESNQRYKKLHFTIPNDTGSAMVHGFAGYFDAVLYKDVHLGIEPSTATPNMFSWFSIFFPLRTPIYLKPGSTLEVWYEWCVTSPSESPIHNSNGRSYWVGL
ncbi:hypothetical protein TSUD_313580 [Trifolium subterraneum]|uniref:Protein arginine N-methyltransferase n=1 Tax=Trifolium subterraneum TaxID=3900 RepID=A0A2Z6N951_TRISU|nr:hypothetical protein TSUD_313580 [Trifolium subterraneum]